MYSWGHIHLLDEPIAGGTRSGRVVAYGPCAELEVGGGAVKPRLGRAMSQREKMLLVTEQTGSAEAQWDPRHRRREGLGHMMNIQSGFMLCS